MLYPLAEPLFEQMNSPNPPSLHSLKAPVVWNEDVYALGRDSNGDGKLYQYSLSNNEWSDLSVPSSIYASHSVLTTYSSKLLLISGKNMSLWEFSNNNFAFKESSIKPIPSTHLSQRFGDIIATSSDTEYLIITYGKTHEPSDRVIFVKLIYNDRDWKL